MTDISWLIALLSPRSVSPHPNFGSFDYRVPAGRLGLLASPYSFNERDEDEQLRLTLTADETTLVDGAALSLRGDAFLDGAGILRSMAERGDVDICLRVPAALLASVALVEADRHADAVAMLGRLASEVEPRDDDGRLMLGTLLQQQAMRLFQMSAPFDEIAAGAGEMLASVDPSKVSRYQTSHGSLWGPVGTNREVLKALLAANSDLSEHSTGFPDTATLKRMLKTPAPRLIANAKRHTSDGESEFIDERFAIYTQSRETSIRNIDPVDDPVWKGLLFFELLGHLRLSRYYRSLLGRVRFMRSNGHPEVVRDALRLLRHADDSKHLGLALEHVRAAGPLQALGWDAYDVALQPRVAGALRKTEIEVLQAGAQLLSQDVARIAFEAVLRCVETGPLPDPGRWTHRFSQLDDVFGAAAALAPVAHADNELAATVLQSALAVGPTDDELLVRSHAVGVGSLDWDGLDSSVREGWQSWAAANPVGWDSLVQWVGANLRSSSVAPGRATLQDVTTALNALITDVPGAEGALPWLRGEGAELVTQQLAATRASAAQGTHAFGGLEVADIAVGLAQYANADIWDDIANFLLDPNIPRSKRNAALDRITHRPDQVPPAVRLRFAEAAVKLLADPDRQMMFEGETVTPYPQALRVLACLSLIDSDRLLTATIALCGGSDVARLEAARTLSTLIQLRRPGLEWAVPVALQITSDPSANVRAAAGRAVALAERDGNSPIGAALVQRLEALLAEDGILVPLLTLRGLAKDGGVLPDAVRPQVEWMAGNHAVWGVRVEAGELLKVL